MDPNGEVDDGGTARRAFGPPSQAHAHSSASSSSSSSIFEVMASLTHSAVGQVVKANHSLTETATLVPLLPPVSSLRSTLVSGLMNFTTAFPSTTTAASLLAPFATSDAELPELFVEPHYFVNDENTGMNDGGVADLAPEVFVENACTKLTLLMPFLPWIRIIFGVLMVAENTLSLAALWRVKRMQAAVHKFISSLAVAEFLMGVWCCYRYGADISFQAGGVDWECRLRFVGNTYLNFVAILSVVGLCLDRCLALHLPFQYSELVTTKRLRAFLAVVWLLPALLVTAAYLETIDDYSKSCTFVHLASRRTYLVLTVSRCVMIGVIIAAELLIFRAARCQIVKIHPNVFISSRNSSRISRMNAKVAITTLAVVLPFLLLYFPVMFVQGYLSVVSLADGDCMSEALSLVWLIASAHGLLTPVVFCWRFREVRRNLLTIVTCGSCHDGPESAYAAGAGAGAAAPHHEHEQRQYPQERRYVISEVDRHSVVFQITKHNDRESAVTV